MVVFIAAYAICLNLSKEEGRCVTDAFGSDTGCIDRARKNSCGEWQLVTYVALFVCMGLFVLFGLVAACAYYQAQVAHSADDIELERDIQNAPAETRIAWDME
jgi:hypothetical protein